MKDIQMTDKELVKSSLKGNLESFRELMEKYHSSAMAAAMNILMNYEDAEDACQEVILKVLKNLGRFDPEKSFKNWFYAILCNYCLDAFRKKKRFRSFLIHSKREIPKPASRAAEVPPSSSLMQSDLLRHLSSKERLALYLWSQEGYSGSEIASILKCSSKTAHVHLYKARVKLKALLKENENAKL
jgi:RNA polymerase sigma-70 factor (ECF subfamily)